MKPDIQKVLEKTLEKFPELRSKDIAIRWEKLEDVLMEIQNLDT